MKFCNIHVIQITWATRLKKSPHSRNLNLHWKRLSKETYSDGKCLMFVYCIFYIYYNLQVIVQLKISNSALCYTFDKALYFVSLPFPLVEMMNSISSSCFHSISLKFLQFISLGWYSTALPFVPANLQQDDGSKLLRDNFNLKKTSFGVNLCQFIPEILLFCTVEIQCQSICRNQQFLWHSAREMGKKKYVELRLRTLWRTIQ